MRWFIALLISASSCLAQLPFQTALHDSVLSAAPDTIDPDIVAWQAALVSAGGTVSAGTLTAAKAFIADLRAANLRSKMVWLNLRCGDYAASKVPVIKDFGTNEVHTNFVSGDYSEATGLTGNATNKRLSTGLNPLAAGLSPGGASLFARIRNAPAAGDKNLFSTASGFPNTRPFYVGLSIGNVPNGQFNSAAITTAQGIQIWTRVSSTDARVYINGLQSGSTYTTSDANAFGADEIQMFYQAAFNSGWSDAQITIAGIGLGLNSSDAANLTTAINTFETALGR